jgi:group I intron endonuclease
MKSTTPVAGVYLITRSGTNQHYVGSSVDISARWSKHLRDLGNGKHHSRHLQSAWNKYGCDAFIFSIVQEVKLRKNKAATSKALVEAEQWWFALYTRGNGKPPAFNVLPFAGTCLGHKHSIASKTKMRYASLGKKLSPGSIAKRTETRRRNGNYKWSPESRAKLIGKRLSPAAIAKRSATRETNGCNHHTIESRAKLSVAQTGKRSSPETRAKISAAKLGKPISPQTLQQRIGRTASPETRAKMSRSRTGMTVSPETRSKIGAAHRGKTVSDETRATLSVVNIGRKRSPESIDKQIATSKRNADLKKLAQSESAAAAAESLQTDEH